MFAPSSRHINCRVALQTLLAAVQTVSRSLPSTVYCKQKSNMPINLAEEWNGDGDCFAWVKINTGPFLYALRRLQLMHTHFWLFKLYKHTHVLNGDCVTHWQDNVKESPFMLLSFLLAFVTADKVSGKDRIWLSLMQIERTVTSKGLKWCLVGSKTLFMRVLCFKLVSKYKDNKTTTLK